MKIHQAFALITLLFFLSCKKNSNEEEKCSNVNGFEILQIDNFLQIYINMASGGIFEIAYLKSGGTDQIVNSQIIRMYSTDSTIVLDKSEFKMNQTYDFYIRKLCSDGKSSDWGFKKTVYLLPYTYIPYHIKYDNGVISWSDSNSNPAAVRFQVQCDHISEIPGEGKIYGCADTFFTKASLSKYFLYSIYVRTYTNESSGWSMWSKPLNITSDVDQQFCLAPSGLNFTTTPTQNPGFNNFQVTWETNGESKFIYYATMPGKIPPPTSGTIVQGKGLIFQSTSTSEFDFYLRSICQNSDTSILVGPLQIRAK